MIFAIDCVLLFVFGCLAYLCGYSSGRSHGYSRGADDIERIYKKCVDEVEASWREAYEKNTARWETVCREIIDRGLALEVKRIRKPELPS